VSANPSLLQPAELRGTVQALRALRSEITRTLVHLEHGLVEEESRRAPVSPRLDDAGYTLFGQTFPVTDGSQIFVDILRHFAKLDSGFPERYSAVVRRLGRKRPYVARSRQALYPGKPHLLSQTAEFAPGWFVGTNEGNEKKIDLLRHACRVLGLRWNHDLKVRMP
jgi:hypothetical protein